MLLLGFNLEESHHYLDLLTDAEGFKLDELVSRVRPLVKDRDTIFYTLPGLPLCWKCTVKHLGEAVGFAREVEKYPERIICVVGALYHAYEECPDKPTAEALRNTYLRILDTGCVPDFTELLKKVSKGWLQDLQEAK